MDTKIEMKKEEWLPILCKGLGIEYNKVTFVYVENMLGNSKMILEHKK